MKLQSFKPPHFKIKLWPWCRITIWQIETTYNCVIYFRFNVPAMKVFRVAREPSSYFLRRFISRQYRYTIPAFLTMPDGMIASVFYGLLRKFFLWCFQFLEACHIRSSFFKPAKQHR